jgi:ssRNA-specific RNase YbeY (16S rRNA maturation enzyme)
MFSLKVVKNPGFTYSQNTLDEISLVISKNILEQQNGTLNIVFIEPLGIQNLNKKYRNIDKVTDVLSFHYHDSYDDLEQDDIA